MLECVSGWASARTSVFEWHQPRGHPRGGRHALLWTSCACEGAAQAHTKQLNLFNALDNDGELRGWLAAHDLAVPPPPAFALPDGTVFGLQAYIDSRATLTAEFKTLMPEMNTFVALWLRARDDLRVVTHERTAKSYFLQEAEGLSHWAKVMWARLRGDVRVTNLQHEGVIVDLPNGMSVAVAEAQIPPRSCATSAPMCRASPADTCAACACRSRS